MTVSSAAINHQSPLRLDYTWTRNMAHYSPLLNVATLGIPLGLVALVETIVEVAKVPLKYAGFFTPQYKNNLPCRPDPSDPVPPKGLDSKKIVYIAGAAIGALIAYAAYQYYFGSEVAEEVENKALQAFISKYNEVEQCPTIEKYIEDQAKNGYWNWSLPAMRALFGRERGDLTLEQTRLGLYHDLQERFEQIAQNHPSQSFWQRSSYTKETAQAISELRDTAREYARERGPRWAHVLLSVFEWRGEGFNYYWEKYGKDPVKIIKGAMRSNSSYDHPLALKFADYFGFPIVATSTTVAVVATMTVLHWVYNFQAGNRITLNRAS